MDDTVSQKKTPIREEVTSVSSKTTSAIAICLNICSPMSCTVFVNDLPNPTDLRTSQCHMYSEADYTFSSLIHTWIRVLEESVGELLIWTGHCDSPTHFGYHKAVKISCIYLQNESIYFIT